METTTIAKVPRERELDWMERNREFLEANYKGNWIVVEGEELVAASSDFSKLLSEIKSKGIIIPFIVYIPENIEGSTVNF